VSPTKDSDTERILSGQKPGSKSQNLVLRDDGDDVTSINIPKNANINFLNLKIALFHY
jgi:hypothetical protein